MTQNLQRLIDVRLNGAHRNALDAGNLLVRNVVDIAHAKHFAAAFGQRVNCLKNLVTHIGDVVFVLPLGYTLYYL